MCHVVGWPPSVCVCVISSESDQYKTWVDVYWGQERHSTCTDAVGLSAAAADGLHTEPSREARKIQDL